MREGSKPPSILVTGATGLLGSELLRCLAGRPVTALSRRGGNGVLALDLSSPADVRALFSDHGFEAVINAAAYSDVDGCEKDPARAHAANALSVKYLAEACSASNTPFIHVSTDYVFDGRKTSPYEEIDPTSPVNIYGMTKLEGEYHALKAPLSAVVRTSWIFGAGANGGFVNAVLERFKKESEIRVLEDQVDAPTYAPDLAEALLNILNGLKTGSAGRRNEIFQVCNRGSVTRYEMTVKMKEILGLSRLRVEKLDAKAIPNRWAIRPAYAVMSTKRYENTFNVRLRPWEEAMKEYLQGNAACAR